MEVPVPSHVKMETPRTKDTGQSSRSQPYEMMSSMFYHLLAKYKLIVLVYTNSYLTTWGFDKLQ
jgi:hypothetical protein